MGHDPSAIRSRRDLAAFLDDVLARRQAQQCVGDDDSAVGDHNALKVFLLESHLPSAPVARGAVLSEAGARFGFEVEMSKSDPDLIVLRFESDGRVWVDASQPRFWRAYALSTVSDAKAWVSSLVRCVDGLDHVWLASSFLERIPTWLDAAVTAFAIHSDRGRVARRSAVTDLPISKLTVRLWGAGQQDRLRELRQSALLRGATALRSIRVRRGTPGDPASEYMATEFFSDGRVTAYGDSFDRLNAALLIVLREYGEVVSGLESRYGFGSVEDDTGCVALRGEPIEFPLDWNGIEPGAALRRVFSGTGPFALFGEPRRLGSARWQVHAIDMHMRQRLTFDFSSERARICLPRDVCGNTVVRFIANLQRHVSSDTSLLELLPSA